MEGAIISLSFSIALSIIGGAGFISSVVIRLITAITELNKTIKEKTQSEDCVIENETIETKTK